MLPPVDFDDQAVFPGRRNLQCTVRSAPAAQISFHKANASEVDTKVSVRRLWHCGAAAARRLYCRLSRHSCAIRANIKSGTVWAQPHEFNIRSAAPAPSPRLRGEGASPPALTGNKL